MRTKSFIISKNLPSFSFFLIALLTVCIFCFIFNPGNVSAAGVYSLNFDGINDYVDMGSGSANLSLANFTVEAWVKPDSSTIQGGIVDKFDFNQFKGFSLEIGNGYFTFLTGAGGGSYNWLTGTDSARSAFSTGNWYHVVAVYDGTTKYLYVNGALTATKVVSYSTSTARVIAGAAYSVGGRTLRFDGIIDEVRIWNVARTVDQINSSKDTELTGSESGLVGYWKFNEGTGTTTADSSSSGNNGTLSPTYPSDSPTWSDSSIMSTFYGPPSNISATALSSSQIQLNWDAKENASGYRIFRDGFWLKDNNTAFGQLKPSCSSNNPAWSTTTALGSYSLDFDGVDDYVKVTDDDILDNATNDFSISAWVWTGSHGFNLSKNHYNGSTYVGYGFFSTSSTLYVSLNDDDSGINYKSLGSFPTDQWAYVTFVIDRSNSVLKYYLDDTLVNTRDISSVNGSIANTDDLLIGRDYYAGVTYFTDGLIDEVRIWNIALTPDQINTYKDAELTGNEAGLVEYWKFNEGSGCIANSGLSQSDSLTTSLTEIGLYPGSSYEYQISTIFPDANSTQKSEAINVTTTDGSLNSIISSSKSAYQKPMTDGDSITYGVGADSLSTAWPHKLKDYLDSNNGNSLTASIYNYGASGSISSGVLSRITANVASTTPDLVAIDIGLNDMRKGDLGSKGTVSIDAYRSNLEQIIDAVNPGRNSALLLGNIPFMTNWTSTGFDWAAGSEVKRAIWNKVVRDVANEKGCILVDVSAAMNASTSLIGDGIHPNQAGHNLIGTTFGNKLILGSSLGIYLNTTNTIYSDSSYNYSPYPTPGVNLVNLSVTPSTSSVDVAIDDWNTTSTYYKKWTEHATTSDITTSHTIGDLRANQYYQLKINGTVSQTFQANTSGIIGFTYSDGYSTKTFEVEEIPTAPTISTPTVLSSSAIRWNFADNAANETGFRVYTNADAIATSSATANLTYLDETGLSENTQYTRYVKAYNSYGESASSSITSTYTLADTPIDLTAINISDQSITASVDVLSNATLGSSGYYFSQGSHNSGWIQTNTWQDTGLGCSNSYTYNVKYRNGNGVETSVISQTFRTPDCAGAVIIYPQTIPATQNLISPQETGINIPTVTFEKPINQMSQEEIKAKITEINHAIIQLRSLLAKAQPTSNSFSIIPNTFSFQTNLKQGTVDTIVKYLQIILNQDPDTQVAQIGVGSPGKETSYFGTLTKQAVIKFQEKYKDEVLKPWGFTKGTGFVGATTRAKINKQLLINQKTPP